MLELRLQDFRIGARILLADPVYSLVAVLGLGIGLAVCLLLLGFARYSWSYDAQSRMPPGISIGCHSPCRCKGNCARCKV
jgi:hypothetical protein